MEFKPYYYQAFAENFILENPEAGENGSKPDCGRTLALRR